VAVFLDQWAINRGGPKELARGRRDLTQSLPNLHSQVPNQMLANSVDFESKSNKNKISVPPAAVGMRSASMSLKLKSNESSKKLLRSPKKQNKKALQTLDTRSTASKMLQEFEQSRSSFETALEDTVKSFTQAIIDSRANALLYSKSAKDRDIASSGGGGLVQQKRAAVAEAKNAHMPSAGVTGLGIEHFTETDRVAVMTSFISRPDVFPLVVHFLLQSQQGMDQGENVWN